VSDDLTESRRTRPATAVADAEPTGSGRRRLPPALIAVIAIGLALPLGWIFAGLPGIGARGSVSLFLLVVGGISGGLTLVFVVNAIRKARHRKRLSLGEMLAVVVSSLITGAISTVQLVQTALQLVQR
jgi:Na+/proline symporter